MNPSISTQPIQDMQFNGLHWIEASAGTGKTYTLSSLMVRILLEKYLPNQVIATTFTRKAAAELKTRVRMRLQQTLQYFESCRTLTEAEMQQRAATESDPLFAVLCGTFALQVGYACERLKLVIEQLDELFIGTLDSFSQKLLREFAFESGKIEYATITDDAKSYSYQLIHDVLREWIQAQPQHCIDFLVLNKKLKSQDAYVDVVEKSLNFASAQFQAVAAPVLDLAQFEAQLSQFSQFDFSQVTSLAEYYAPEGQYHAFLAKSWSKNLTLQQLLLIDLPDLVQDLQQQGSYAIFSAQHANTLKLLHSLNKKVLNKCADEVLQTLESHPLMPLVAQLCDYLERLTLDLDQLDQHLKFHLAHEVKKRLPQLLQQKGETTFAQQIRTLALSLQGQQGQRFAAYVHARYPLILVDEFQDTNQDQDDMLAQIWRHPSRVKQGCMIMVGDRKQAIYGFRGGDMLTFLKAHQDVFGKEGHAYNLMYNHRSVAELVNVVDALFQRQADFGEQVLYTPVQAGQRPHPSLIDHGQINPQPLRWIELQDQDEAEQVAWKIRDLLNQGIAGQLYLDAASPQPIIENDIAVLSKNHDGLDQVQAALEFLGIAVKRPSKKSVFESQIARDVGALLTAILHPFDEAKLKRALLSRLLGFNLHQLMQLQMQADGLSAYIEQFDHIRELWFNQGFLNAWQYALNHFHIWKNLVATQSRDNERAVVNLRHLTELLSQHSEQYTGAQSLYHWYIKQLTQPLQRDWEMQRQLSNETGIQLMTIHQSKGLEFKIVFLLGADKAAREQNKTLNFSTLEHTDPLTGQSQAQRIIAIHNSPTVDKTALAQHEERFLAENRRLWYVALTRASHRVYAMLSDSKASSTTGLAFWRGHAPDQFQHPSSQLDALCFSCPAPLKPVKTAQAQPLQALDFPQQRFYPRAKTSFSALAQHLSRQQIQDRLAVLETEQGSADDEQHVSEIALDSQHSPPIAWIKAHFPMGTLAGSFLHEIFEHLNFQDSKDWGLEIKRRFKNKYAQLWQELYLLGQHAFPNHPDVETHLIDALKAWLQQVLATPLHGNFQLNQLQEAAYLAEFPFYLALSDRVLSISRVHQLFSEYGIQMPEFLEANAARYLKGEIDLVFYDGQQYHIADYKSNFLGNQQHHYAQTAIQDSMSHASYWLQAALYLVALHRYLSQQLDGYSIERDLGGASYLYLRGMNGQAEQGYFYWKPSCEFILRLDAILGHFNPQNMAKIS